MEEEEELEAGVKTSRRDSNLKIERRGEGG